LYSAQKLITFEPNKANNRRMKYNWQQKDWPQFKYSPDGLNENFVRFIEETALLGGMVSALPEEMQTETLLSIMLAEAIKTSEIEGEFLSRPDVLSSIRNKLGLNVRPDSIKDKRAKGVGELMVAVRNTFSERLTEEMLLSWHAMLMKYNTRINVAAWRSHQEPMQVVSGTLGKEKVHFEAPPSSRVPAEMKKFIVWFNDTAPGGKKEIRNAPVRAAIAHLYFESIHPFEDGNGRMGRAIAEKALFQTAGRPLLLSLSQIIESGKSDYYKGLEQAQRSNEISAWIRYFVDVVVRATLWARNTVEFTLKKSRFFDFFKVHLNERQTKAIRRMMDAEPERFTGGMTAKKYMSITKASKATATRDLQHLVELNILMPSGAGRSVHYGLNM